MEMRALGKELARFYDYEVATPEAAVRRFKNDVPRFTKRLKELEAENEAPKKEIEALKSSMY